MSLIDVPACEQRAQQLITQLQTHAEDLTLVLKNAANPQVLTAHEHRVVSGLHALKAEVQDQLAELTEGPGADGFRRAAEQSRIRAAAHEQLADFGDHDSTDDVPTQRGSGR